MGFLKNTELKTRRLTVAERPHGIGQLILEAAAVDSTNKQLAALGQVGAVHGCMLVTKTQIAGNAKGSRTWFSRTDGSLAMSVLIRTSRGLAEAAQLPLLAGVALRETLAEVAGVETQIKWPNDLLIEGRKICGILAEARTNGDGELDYVVVGLGLNLDIKPENFPVELRATATSVATHATKSASYEEVLGTFAEIFDRWFLRWEKEGLSAFAATWTEHAYKLGRVVSLTDGDEDLCGEIIGLANDGALRIRDAGGALHDVHSGEIATGPIRAESTDNYATPNRGL